MGWAHSPLRSARALQVELTTEVRERCEDPSHSGFRTAVKGLDIRA